MAELILGNLRGPLRFCWDAKDVAPKFSAARWLGERACILATCVGTMRRQLERSIAYARTRKQFGQPIGKFQSVANRIVYMKLRYGLRD